MLKILYITPLGIKSGFNTTDKAMKNYDMDLISNSIIEKFLLGINDVEITHLNSVIDPDVPHDINIFKKYDIFICDLTTMNPNVLFQVGQASGLGKPIIYIRSHESNTPARLVHERILTYSDTSISDEFIAKIQEIIKAFIKDPNSLNNITSINDNKKSAFISYSHKDKVYLDRLMVHLKPLAKKGLIDIWVDTKINTGNQWKVEIEKALEKSSISILLVSADFMASDFIVDNELPPLLSKAEVNGTQILPVIISPCRFSREPTLNRFQAANSPSEPLSSMSEDEKEKIFDNLANDIENSLGNI